MHTLAYSFTKKKKSSKPRKKQNILIYNQIVINQQATEQTANQTIIKASKREIKTNKQTNKPINEQGGINKIEILLTLN